MHYTGTHSDCEAYNDTVTAGERYMDSTTQWATVRKHPTEDLYAIVKHEDYDADMTLVELDSSWEADDELL